MPPIQTFIPSGSKAHSLFARLGRVKQAQQSCARNSKRKRHGCLLPMRLNAWEASQSDGLKDGGG
eukprot:5129903-Pyramimonas_sp.AAC.1